MSDIRTHWVDLQSKLDFGLDELGLETDDGLETAVVLSLFTDRRAGDADELPPGSSDRRGWWGDSFADDEGDQMGSRLWLLKREKQLPAGLARAREYAEEALRWLLDDQVASSVSVVASNPRDGILGLKVSITRLGSNAPVTFRFESAWSAT